MSRPRHQLDFYFSFISLWSYIGSLPFQDLVRRYQLDVTYKPIDLYQVFGATGGKPPKERPLARQAYRWIEMERWQKIRGIALTKQPKFYPAQPSIGHRMLLAAQSQDANVHHFAHLALKAVWADEQNIEDPQTLIALANAGGLDGAALLAQSAQPEFSLQERALTDEALSRNVFGAPFYFYKGEPFWGQDRLDLLERAIQDDAPPSAAPRP